LSIRVNNKKLKREKKTVKLMIEIFCQDNHLAGQRLCPECEHLYEYSITRIANCLYAAEKSVCVKCNIHCYRTDMQDKIRKVMRFSGPKMISKHPFLTILHFLDLKNLKKGYLF
jgi:hypothetical protein